MFISIGGFYVNILELPAIALMIIIIVADLSLLGTKLHFKKKKYINIIVVSLLIFLASILLSSITALSVSSVFKSFVKWIEILFIAVLTLIFIRNHNRFKFVYWLLFFSFSLPIGFTVIQIMRGDLPLLGYRILPSFDSLYAFCLVTPFILSNNRKLALSLSSVFSLSTILSLSRGAWLGLLIISVYFLRTLNTKKVKIAIVLCFVAFMLIVVVYEPLNFLFVDRISVIFRLDQQSNVERTAMLRYASMAFVSSPIWGIGALNFPHYIIQNRLTKGMVAEDVSNLQPHNFFVQTLAEEGIIGFTAILIFLISLYFLLFRINKVKPENHEFGCYLLGLRLLFIGIILNLAFGFIANQFRFNLALFVGIVLSRQRL